MTRSRSASTRPCQRGSRRLVGDIYLREPARSLRARLTTKASTVIGKLERVFGDTPPTHQIVLALDWNGSQHELLVGRHHARDVKLENLSVSRRHARLLYRDGHWMIQDLGSTNGTFLNSLRVGRCELRPGDHLSLGAQHLLID